MPTGLGTAAEKEVDANPSLYLIHGIIEKFYGWKVEDLGEPQNPLDSLEFCPKSSGFPRIPPQILP